MGMELTDKKLKLTKKRIESLERLGIKDADALIMYIPFRYEQIVKKPFSEWSNKDKVSFEAKIASPIRSFHFRTYQSGANFDVLMEDQLLHITIFNQPWVRSLRMNDVITITGTYQGASKVIASFYKNKPMLDLEQITPVYASKSGISQKTIRACVKYGLEGMNDEIQDLVPICLMRKYHLMSRRLALWNVHFPANMNDVKLAYRTLKYEEFLRFFTAMQLMKNESMLDGYIQPRIFDETKLEHLINQLPFELTKDQKETVDAITNDMQSSRVVYRLVQGDVGCGKTLVAMLCMYAEVLSGHQAALMAPTEILARQHYQEVCKYLEPLGVRCGLLFSGLATSEKNEVLQGIQDGTIDVVVGTQSLIQEGVSFYDLGMVVADEQHRFGVAQRQAIRDKGKGVDFILMSATPIPRTLATTLYGDMEVSTIKTMPKGRKMVQTVLIHENSFRSVLPQIESLLEHGKQLYVVCAAVEYNEEYPARNVNDVAHNLSVYFNNKYQVGILHGKMSTDEKQQIMQDFNDNKIQILVTTTVVEVGMNVVNATGMIIYNAERFGLSQLHQLRGRVQRGSEMGRCYVLSDTKDEMSLNRLEVLEKTSDGFLISYEDLRLRGPGDILGTRQSGAMDFVLGNLVEDTDIIETARKDAIDIINDLDNPDYELLLETVRKELEKNS